ncbi:MAG: hypothetical protein ACOYXM_11565 [Actinomycetota bacterium]
MHDRRALGVTAVATALAVLASAQVAWASFDDSAQASATYSTDTLAAPTSPTAGPGTCTAFSNDRIILSWTATTSTWADGYEIARSLTPGGPYTVIGTVTGVGTTTYNDGPLAFSTTYHYAIRSTRNLWRSANATVSRTTRSSLCI